MDAEHAPVRLAVVGTGVIADRHCGAIAHASNAELAAVVSRRVETAIPLARRYNTVPVGGYRHALESDEIDGVALCSPNGLHAGMALEALAAGKHVMVEKPVATSVEGAERVVAEAEECGLKLGVIYQARFNPLVRKLKRRLDEGVLGRLVLADGYLKWRRLPEYYATAPWRGTWEGAGGGALDTQAVSVLDLLLWLAGPVRAASAYIGTLVHAIEVEDTGVAILRYANGALGVVEATTSLYPEFPERLEISGAAGSVSFENIYIKGESRLRWQLRDEPGEVVERELDLVEPERHEAIRAHGWHIGQYEDFAEAILQGREPQVNGREGLRSLVLLEALYRSAREGREVVVSDGPQA